MTNRRWLAVDDPSSNKVVDAQLASRSPLLFSLVSKPEELLSFFVTADNGALTINGKTKQSLLFSVYLVLLAEFHQILPNLAISGYNYSL